MSMSMLTTGLDSWDAHAMRRAYGAVGGGGGSTVIKGVGDVEVEDLVCPLAWQDVLIAGSEAAVSICGFPAFVGDGEYAANGVRGRGAFVSEFGRW
eukprot:scaffold56767_cov42-Attheya_sp.AAC.1